MKILVIGGSYFFGRWFVQLAHAGHEITVLNRGNVRVGLENVRELKADRHIEGELLSLSIDRDKYDAVVDFCAYAPGDIADMLSYLDTAALNRYIFISTVDVYRRGTGLILTEDSPLESRSFAGEEGAYITGKVTLETELKAECERHGIIPVSVRPAVLYGPGNYAPRESVYFKWIGETGQIIHPEGADGYWQMIYVKDAAQAVLKLCEMPEDKLGRAYNLCSDELITYDTFEAALNTAYESRRDGITCFTKAVIDAGDLAARGIQLPFPAFASESERYSGEVFKSLDITLTPLADGLVRCLELFAG